MATRRARIKLAPNLGLSRNKNKIAPVVASKPKIVIKSDTESESNLSDHETVDETSVPNVVENLANQISLKEFPTKAPEVSRQISGKGSGNPDEYMGNPWGIRPKKIILSLF